MELYCTIGYDIYTVSFRFGLTATLKLMQRYLQRTIPYKLISVEYPKIDERNYYAYVWKELESGSRLVAVTCEMPSLPYSYPDRRRFVFLVPSQCSSSDKIMTLIGRNARRFRTALQDFKKVYEKRCLPIIRDIHMYSQPYIVALADALKNGDYKKAFEVICEHSVKAAEYIGAIETVEERYDNGPKEIPFTIGMVFQADMYLMTLLYTAHWGDSIHPYITTLDILLGRAHNPRILAKDLLEYNAKLTAQLLTV